MTREQPTIAAFQYLKKFIRKIEKDFLPGPVMIGKQVMVLN